MARVTKRVIFKASISYPHLSEPVVNPNDKNKDPQYSIEARIPKSDVDTIKKVRSVLEEVYTEGAGPDKKKWKVDFREPGFLIRICRSKARMVSLFETANISRAAIATILFS